MTYESCPQLDELSWLQHGFFNRGSGVPSDMTGIQYFSDRFKRIFYLPQTHSDTSIALMETAPPQGADASYVLRNDKDVALGVKTADCCPVLVACTRTKIVAAIHAGWPGALNQIVPKTIHKLRTQGAEPSRMIVALGPCLQQKSFAVQDDVRDKFAALQPDALPCFEKFEDRWKLDMPGVIKQQLIQLGVFHIWQSQIDTLSDDKYFSYRRRATDPESTIGRNVSVILKKETV